MERATPRVNLGRAQTARSLVTASRGRYARSHAGGPWTDQIATPGLRPRAVFADVDLELAPAITLR